MRARSILHIDMGAFFAAIEILDHPSLSGRPVIVGGTPEGHGVVSTADYEARRFGVRSAMPAATARRLCPDGVFLMPRHDRYVAVSRVIFNLLREESPAVEPVSIDEAFIDLTGTERRLGDPVECARRIKARIRKETGLTCSAGRAGWRTIGDLQAAGEARLARILGREAARWVLPLALGIDDRPVVGEGEGPKSIGHETTFAVFLSDPEAVETALLNLAEAVGRRLRGEGMKARTVTLKVRDETFRTQTRARTLAEPTDIGLEIFRAARDLLRERIDLAGRRVRLLGQSVRGMKGSRVTSSRLEGGGWEQLSLLPDGRERQEDLARAVDAIKDRLGEEAIRPARLLRGADRRRGRAT